MDTLLPRRKHRKTLNSDTTDNPLTEERLMSSERATLRQRGLRVVSDSLYGKEIMWPVHMEALTLKERFSFST